MAKSKKRYLVFTSDIANYNPKQMQSGYFNTFETEADAEEYAATATAQGGVATIAVSIKLLKPKPVEMVTIELAEEC